MTDNAAGFWYCGDLAQGLTFGAEGEDRAAFVGVDDAGAVRAGQVRCAVEEHEGQPLGPHFCIS
ncbi:hypothetical protein [Nonomuraea aurantiaca]|uniref:hypothetical protein n=1 Tax=Nonomuraea aurantiaca TaxID=2878562 RepID=UPI001CD9548D|nr:hypothetical protein [Nonomuraea aurantiaca]MCA2224975.1 hypothetical protein [Nonomuraea aurantiaca]